MPYYQFALDNGSGTEDLGGIPLADDPQAITFGEQVIRDLKRMAGDYQQWSIDITEGERIVGTIPFELGRLIQPN
jgi:hypothetical protein